MPVRLRKEEVVTLEVLADKGLPNTAIARTLQVSEGTVRYHLRRRAAGAVDGRQNKPFKAETLEAVIAHWYATREGAPRPVNVRELHDHLVAEHGYAGAYRSVLRYVRHTRARPKIRTYRRVETPPGAQGPTDWEEFPQVWVGGELVPLHAFLMALSHSRKVALVWSWAEDELSWLACHNGAFTRLGGIPAVNRIDNLKTGVARGAGAWGVVNETYQAYARSVGFHVDACAPYAPQAKGKVEAKCRLGRLRADPTAREFDALEELQAWSDRRLEAWAKRAICPATGRTVQDSWELEREHLAPLPLLPEPFDVVVTRPVQRDCTVHFEGRVYAVPFRFVGQAVEVRGCAGKVQVLAQGKVVQEYPRHTAARVQFDPRCFEGPATDTVRPPPPLGRMGRRLQELYALPVERRPVDLYAALAEVAR